MPPGSLTPMIDFLSVSTGAGRQRLAPLGRIDRHHHVAGYIALVLSGGYDEAGDHGRRRVVAGEFIVHQSFESHVNVVAARGAEVLNLPLVAGIATAWYGRIEDIDHIARLAETDGLEAARTMLSQSHSDSLPGYDDWPDMLAAACRDDPALRLGDWAGRHGLAPATISRGFAAVYGVSPARYRAEARARRALKAIEAGSGSLAAVAHDAGFADQAHMTRGVARLTGRPAGWWQRHVKSVQDRPGAAA